MPITQLLQIFDAIACILFGQLFISFNILFWNNIQLSKKLKKIHKIILCTLCPDSKSYNILPYS